ncbi:hypothetical protein GW15_0203400 [Xanthomonas axonopodis pv. vasculorum]|uniref:Uncharacterized protein n=1 Tax=Xanthomonas axonopodis pv. vasculorum TaxID=325777 RepID=A0A098Q1M6_9XANT|nr:hypothetical protein GW15_0203400 [Xanthomonas axonopodis pv. vasculorum]PPV10001.1 hypothetical protein XavaCFBP5823_11380 [Xanthomonas axonopodis pv. vasculorum]
MAWVSGIALFGVGTVHLTFDASLRLCGSSSATTSRLTRCTRIAQSGNVPHRPKPQRAAGCHCQRHGRHPDQGKPMARPGCDDGPALAALN